MSENSKPQEFDPAAWSMTDIPRLLKHVRVLEVTLDELWDFAETVMRVTERCRCKEAGGRPGHDCLWCLARKIVESNKARRGLGQQERKP